MNGVNLMKMKAASLIFAVIVVPATALQAGEAANKPLIAAASTGNVARVRELLAQGAYVDERDQPSLYAQLSADGNDIVAYFPPEKHITTPIVVGNAVTELVIEPPEGATLVPIGGNRTPLIHAAENGHLEVVKLLLDKGANIDAQDNADSTALIEASIAGHKAVVKLLLEKGTKVDIKTKAGKTALQYAEEKEHKEIAQLLKQHTMSPKPPGIKADKEWKLIEGMEYTIANARSVIATCDKFTKTYPNDSRVQEARGKLDKLVMALSKVPQTIRTKGIPIVNGFAMNLKGAYISEGRIDLKKEKNGLLSPDKPREQPQKDGALAERASNLQKILVGMTLSKVVGLIGQADDIFEQVSPSTQYERICFYKLKDEKTAILWFDKNDALVFFYVPQDREAEAREPVQEGTPQVLAREFVLLYQGGATPGPGLGTTRNNLWASDMGTSRKS